MDPTNREDIPADRPPGGTVHPLRRRLEQAASAGIAFRDPEDEDEFAGYTMGAAAGPAVHESLEQYESFEFAEDQPATPAPGPPDHEAAAPQGADPEEIPQPRPEPSPAPARAHRRGPPANHHKPAVRHRRRSENNQQPDSPPAAASHAHPRRRRAALGGLTAAVVVVLAAFGVGASTGGQRTPRRVADEPALVSRSKIRTPLFAPVAANFARGYAIVVFAARRVGVQVELLAAKRRRELALKRRRAAQAAAAAAAAQTAQAQAAAAAQTSPAVSDTSGASGGAGSSYQPPATSTGSSSSQGSSGAASSSGSSGSGSSGSGSSGSAATTSTPTKTGQPICYPGTLGCWPGGPATK